MFHIEKIYSQHVVSDWLPNTAKCLLKKWYESSQELIQLGLPCSSGALKGDALKKFQSLAVAEGHRILDFMVQEVQTAFWRDVAKPVKEYLESSLRTLSEQKVHLLELEQFLALQAEEIRKGLKLEEFSSSVVDKAKKALDERQDDSPFKLGRLPALKKKLSQNLEENKPRLDVDAARRSISTFLRTVLVGPSQVSEGLLSLKHEDDTGKVSVTLNAQHIVGVCLRKLSVNFTTLKSNQDLEKKVIEKAVAVQETETCHTTRQRIYKQMNRYAEALDKLVKMHCDVSSSEAPPDSKSILVRWWPEDALTVAKDDSWGDDETDNTKFKSEKCNWVQAAMKEKK